jgi:hypothetical protein
MILDWLFGPEIDQYAMGKAMGTGFMGTRSVTIDLDTVREVREVARRALRDNGMSHETLEFKVRQLSGTFRAIPEEELQLLSHVDRGRLILEGRFGREAEHLNGSININFVRHEFPLIEVTYHQGDLNVGAVQDAIARKILDEGTPRIAWTRLAAPATFIPLAALIISWVCIETLSPNRLVAAHVFGWMIIAFATAGTIIASNSLRKRLAPKHRGHFILMETRAETAARRADKKANLRVGIIVALVTAALTLLVAWLTGFLQPPG